ncbi:hypothetical protein GGI20_004450, partial [Coemansia sp. BCRC 34301]
TAADEQHVAVVATPTTSTGPVEQQAPVDTSVQHPVAAASTTHADLVERQAAIDASTTIDNTDVTMEDVSADKPKTEMEYVSADIDDSDVRMEGIGADIDNSGVRMEGVGANIDDSDVRMEGASGDVSNNDNVAMMVETPVANYPVYQRPHAASPVYQDPHTDFSSAQGLRDEYSPEHPDNRFVDDAHPHDEQADDLYDKNTVESNNHALREFSLTDDDIDWLVVMGFSEEVLATIPTSGITIDRNAYGDIFGGGLEEFVQNHLHADCRTVFKLTTPVTTTLCTMTDKLVDKIATDLEARMLRAANDKKTRNDPQGSGHDADQLSVWATDILDWTDVIASLYESFLLFVAYNVKAYATDTESEGAEYCDPRDFVRILCSMLPLASNVESQKTLAPHLVVADTEVMSDKRGYDDGELELAKETRPLYFRQHNRRFA